MLLKRSNEWIATQLLTLGSTAAGVIGGQSPYQKLPELYDAMVAAAEGRITEKDLNDDMRRGLLTEPLHRSLLSEALGHRVDEHAVSRSGLVGDEGPVHRIALLAELLPDLAVVPWPRREHSRGSGLPRPWLPVVHHVNPARGLLRRLFELDKHVVAGHSDHL